jgi:hypothetical protein
VPGNYTKILVASITVPVYAYYLVIRGVNWSKNSSGIRLISDNPNGNGRNQTHTMNPVSGESLYQQYVMLELRNVGQTIECYAAQNSGTDITVYPYINAILLR